MSNINSIVEKILDGSDVRSMLCEAAKVNGVEIPGGDLGEKCYYDILDYLDDDDKPVPFKLANNFPQFKVPEKLCFIADKVIETDSGDEYVTLSFYGADDKNKAKPISKNDCVQSIREFVLWDWNKKKAKIKLGGLNLEIDGSVDGARGVLEVTFSCNKLPKKFDFEKWINSLGFEHSSFEHESDDYWKLDETTCMLYLPLNLFVKI